MLFRSETRSVHIEREISKGKFHFQTRTPAEFGETRNIARPTHTNIGDVFHLSSMFSDQLAFGCVRERKGETATAF